MSLRPRAFPAFQHLAFAVAAGLVALSGAASADVAPNQVRVYDSPNYRAHTTMGYTEVTLSPRGDEIQHGATFRQGMRVRSVEVGSDVAVVLYPYEPQTVPILGSFHQTPITQSVPSMDQWASYMVVMPRWALGPLPSDNPMRIVFESRSGLDVFRGRELIRVAFAPTLGRTGQCQTLGEGGSEWNPHVIEAWTGNRPQSDLQLYLYPEPHCRGGARGVTVAGRLGGIELPVPGMNEPIRSFMAIYRGPTHGATRSTGDSGAGVAVPPTTSAPPLAPTPGYTALPVTDLSGRWRARHTGEIVEFRRQPNGDYVATTPEGTLQLTMRANGGLRLLLQVAGQTAVTDGEIAGFGPPNRTAHMLSFNPLPGQTDRLILDRLAN